MAITLHKKTIYINAEKNWIASPRFTKLSFTPTFTYNDHYAIYFYIRDNNNIAIDLTGYTFKFGLDYTFLTGHTDLVTSTNFDVTSASSGLVICYLNCRSTSLLTYLDDDKNKTGYAVLWAYYGGQPNQLITQFACTLNNICGDIDEELSSYNSSSSSSSSSSSIDSSSSSSSSSEGYSSSSSSSSSSSEEYSSESSSSSLEYSSSSSTSSSSSYVPAVYIASGGDVVPPGVLGGYYDSGEAHDAQPIFTNGTYYMWYSSGGDLWNISTYENIGLGGYDEFHKSTFIVGYWDAGLGSGTLEVSLA